MVGNQCQHPRHCLSTSVGIQASLTMHRHSHTEMSRAENPRLPWPWKFCPRMGQAEPGQDFPVPFPSGWWGSAWKKAASISSWAESPFSRGRGTTRISINAGETGAWAGGGGEGPVRPARLSRVPALGMPRGRLGTAGLLPPHQEIRLDLLRF